MTAGIPPAQTYRLRWNNDSSAGLDLQEEFRGLRKNSDFFDTSLVCSVNSGGSLSLKAHKIILSAYSGVFREMFRQNANRQDPFIYLKGVSFSNLSNLLDFMYNGEANVSQANLSSFLSLAEELQVKGLQLINKDATSAQKPAPIKRQASETLETSFKRERIQTASKQGSKGYKGYAKDEDDAWNPKKRSIKKESIKKEYTKINDEDWMPQNFSADKENQDDDFYKSLNDSLTSVSDPIGMDRSQDFNDSEVKGKSSIEEEEEENDEPIQEGQVGDVTDFIKNIPPKLTGTKSRTMSRCRICLKEYRRDKIKPHIIRAHPQYLSSSANQQKSEQSLANEEEFVSMANDEYSAEAQVHEDSD